uniref:Uncharacterized protein n=1 Tax=Arcella intermedia TaxID=1963864 RepID=A0A6B2LND0_9EUKA
MNWLSQARSSGNDPIIFLLGNKLDLLKTPSDRTVSNEEAKQFADKHRLTFYEVSAKSTENIVDAVSDLYLQIYLKANSIGDSPIFKYIFIGDSGVGKSSLLMRFEGCNIDLSGLPPDLKPITTSLP